MIVQKQKEVTALEAENIEFSRKTMELNKEVQEIKNQAKSMQRKAADELQKVQEDLQLRTVAHNEITQRLASLQRENKQLIDQLESLRANHEQAASDLKQLQQA